MAHARSTKKRIRQNKVRQMRNRGYKRHIKKKTNTALTATPDEKATALSEAYSAIDRAVKKGVIHKNTASRRKSRLAKKTAV